MGVAGGDPSEAGVIATGRGEWSGTTIDRLQPSGGG